MANIRFRLHKQGEESVLAAADEDTLGVKHRGEKAVLDLVTFRAFYDGENATEGKLASLLQSCSSANLVGEAAVGVALKEGRAQEKDVLKVGKVPHLQIYRVEK